MHRARFIFAAVGVLFATHGLADEVSFDRDIRPILSGRCFHCHGPDKDQRKAELRLDTSQGAFEDRGGYAAFVAGEPDESEALRRIMSDDPDEQMPPPGSKLAVTDAERARLRKWVAAGADWAEHWAFVAPNKVTPPATDWSANPIDGFVDRRMRQNGLRPSEAADRATLIRRVTLDLTGLPPTPEEVDAFLNDESPEAYERVVDRLLQSQRYGERMAWEWLDAARYADTDGFQGDPTRTMWPWRDWLVKALNDNQPFDQFTVEMIAGDLLPNTTEAQILATGFHRNHMYNGEGGRIAEETRVENVFDRTETTSTVWLGLTMTCCRCHDHKYDPIKQREYYELYAFFNNTSESGRGGRGKAPPVLNYLADSTRQEIAALDLQIASADNQLTQDHPELDAQQVEWETAQLARLRDAEANGKETVFGAWQVIGPLPPPDGNAATLFDHDFGPETKIDLAAPLLDDQFHWTKRPDFADGKIHPFSDTVGATYLYRTIQVPGDRTLDLSFGSDDGIKVWLDGKQVVKNDARRAAAADQESVKLDLESGEHHLLIKVTNTGGIGGFYFRKKSESIGGLSPEIAKLLLVPRNERTPAQTARIRSYFRPLHSVEIRRAQGALKKLRQKRSELAKSGVSVMVMDDLPSDKQRTSHIMIRGGYDKPGAEVTPETPSLLPPLPESAPRNRLGLANWLVDPTNPLTARVTVNRYWQTFFGRGIVASTEDFGVQGDRPTHPELLDWLATQFIESGWDVKAIHKLMVTSATYRQSAVISDDAAKIDPANRWLSRSPRYRLPAWMLRDQALAISGLLVEKLGGPAVRPYQPEGIWAEATFGKIRYQQDSGDSLYRRSMYIFWRRIVGPTMFFDGSKRQTCEVKPTRTNTPLHALTTLNETTFVEASRAFAERLMTTPGKDTVADRIRFGFRLATARLPDEREFNVLHKRWQAMNAQFAKMPESAAQLLSVGDSKVDPDLNPGELAAYTIVCSILLNLDETLSHE